MRILNWNVNGLRAIYEKGFDQIIRSQKPDIICLQEIKSTPEQVPETFLKTYGGFAPAWAPAIRAGYSGCLTLHRSRPRAVQIGMGQKTFDQEGRVVISEYEEFTLMNMYFPNGGMGEDRHLFKMKFLKEILKFFKAWDKGKPLILTGDFNIAHKAIDIHDPVRLDGESGFKPEERAWMDELVDAGFVDAFRLFHPSEKDAYTWWSYRQGSRPRNKGWRIDYFFISKRLEPKVKSCTHLDQVMGSDHCPLLLEVGVTS